MGTRRATVLAVALVAALLSGCASGTDEPPAPGGTVSPSPAPSPSSSFPEDLPTPSGSSPGSPGSPGKPTVGAEQTISGRVVEGVEAGCRLLGEYLLLPGPGISRDAFQAGATVTVRGRVERGMMTTCQQGTPFVVSEVLPG